MRYILFILLALQWSQAVHSQDVMPTIVGQKDLSTTQGNPITIQLTDLYVQESDNEGDSGDNDNHDSDQEDEDGNNDDGDGTGGDKDEDKNDDERDDDDDDKSDSGDKDKNDNKGNKDDKDDKNNNKNDKGDKKNKDDKHRGNGRSAYPEGYLLEIFSGENYTSSGNTVTPAPSFTGILIVNVRVKNQKNASPTFGLKISVIPLNTNQPPAITGQLPLSTTKDTPIEIKLSHILVEDADDKYPEGFTLSLTAGTNFTLKGTTVTPAPGFTGDLIVAAVVSDGEDESAPFLLKITVTTESDNVAPQITGQVPLSISANQSVGIVLSHLLITDPDNQFPQDFELHTYQGEHYSLLGNTVTPEADFTGDLIVEVSVNDGEAESNVFNFRITVTPGPNQRPVITGQAGIKITQDQRFEISFDHLVVEDPDDTYPEGFSIILSAGDHYTFENQTVAPAPEFRGTLTIRLIVHDGQDPSEPYDLKVEVIESARLEIVGQQPLAMSEDSTFYLRLSHLTVNDPSGTYPQGFTLRILDGGNYKVEDGGISPEHNFSGNLTVSVAVSKEENTSAPFDLLIVVAAVNDPPELLRFDDAPLVFSGTGALSLAQGIEVADVDDDFMLLAEIGFDADGYQPGVDQLEFERSEDVRGIFDTRGGVLFLVGRGSKEAYSRLLRSVEYVRGVSPDSLHMPRSKRIYLKLNDGKDWSSVYSRLLITEKNDALEIPSAFTPNNDQANDTWKIVFEKNTETIHAFVRVYDKKGMLVFEASDLQTEWDGYFNGSPLPSDVYFYSIEMDLSHKKVNYKGIVSILR